MFWWSRNGNLSSVHIVKSYHLLIVFFVAVNWSLIFAMVFSQLCLGLKAQEDTLTLKIYVNLTLIGWNIITFKKKFHHIFQMWAKVGNITCFWNYLFVLACIFDSFTLLLLSLESWNILWFSYFNCKKGWLILLHFHIALVIWMYTCKPMAETCGYLLAGLSWVLWV